MAENQNCSETTINDSAGRKKTNLSTLSRILKNQTSSSQHRTCPNIKIKPSWSFRMFFIKTLIGGGAIYLTGLLGVWGDAEQSTKMFSNMKQCICENDNEKIISNQLKADVVDKMKKSKEFLMVHLEGLPEELKVLYDKSEKYMNELIKGKK